jgi:molybdopterin/thiamine biosynthesis adenylyltransferase
LLQKSTTLARKLAEMNPFMKVEFCESLSQNQKVSVVISSLNCFNKAYELNEKCRKLPSKPAFYALNCSGLFGFAFVDLQKLSYSFAEKTGDGEQT